MDRITFSHFEARIRMTVVGRGDMLHRVEAGYRLQVARGNPGLYKAVHGTFNLNLFHGIPDLLQGRPVGVPQVD